MSAVFEVRYECPQPEGCGNIWVDHARFPVHQASVPRYRLCQPCQRQFLAAGRSTPLGVPVRKRRGGEL